MPFRSAETRRVRRRPLFCKAEAARDGTSAFHKGGRGLPPPPTLLFIKKGDTQVKKREKYKLNWAALLLAAALARADEIAAESGLDFPRLLTLEGRSLATMARCGTSIRHSRRSPPPICSAVPPARPGAAASTIFMSATLTAGKRTGPSARSQPRARCCS